MVETMGFPFSPAMIMAMEKITVNTMRAMRFDLENSSGKSLTVNIPRKFMLPEASVTSSVRLRTAPFPGSKIRDGITINRQAITPVTMVPTRKVIIIFLSFARSSILEMAEVREQKIRGTTQQYRRFKKISATGWRTDAPSPQNSPTTPPTTIAPRSIKDDL